MTDKCLDVRQTLLAEEKMKKIIFCFFVLIIAPSIFGQNQKFELYVTDHIKLRDNPTLTAHVIAVLPKYTAVHLITDGATQIIDGISGRWISVISQNGYSGWSFSGYVKDIESNIAQDLADTFANYKSGNFPGKIRKDYKYPGVSDIRLIKAREGYYIQQQLRSFQGRGKAPEILKLTVAGEKVFLSEIDIIKNNAQEKPALQLEYDGVTFSKGKTRIFQVGDNIVIRYMEHIPQDNWLGTWEYEEFYTYASSLNNLKIDKITRLTSDYLKNYTGEYIFDSIDVASDTENSDIKNLAMKTIINIEYDINGKYLTLPIHNLIDCYEPGNGVGNFMLNFVETTFNEPFFWAYGEGEGVGHSEEMFFFYKGGIGLRYEDTGAVLGDDELTVIRNKHQLFYIFFKKK